MMFDTPIFFDNFYDVFRGTMIVNHDKLKDGMANGNPGQTSQHRSTHCLW